MLRTLLSSPATQSLQRGISFHVRGKSLASLATFSSKAYNGVYERITFIGAGKMAQALINPLIKTGVQPAENITIYDVSKSTMKSISDEYQGKIGTSSSIQNAVEGADLIVMAVKPQNVCKVYAEIKKAQIREDCTLLSVIAGKPVQVRLCTRILNHNFIIQYHSNVVPISKTFPPLLLLIRVLSMGLVSRKLQGRCLTHQLKLVKELLFGAQLQILKQRKGRKSKQFCPLLVNRCLSTMKNILTCQLLYREADQLTFF